VATEVLVGAEVDDDEEEDGVEGFILSLTPAYKDFGLAFTSDCVGFTFGFDLISIETRGLAWGGGGGNGGDIFRPVDALDDLVGPGTSLMGLACILRTASVLGGFDDSGFADVEFKTVTGRVGESRLLEASTGNGTRGTLESVDCICFEAEDEVDDEDNETFEFSSVGLDGGDSGGGGDFRGGEVCVVLSF